MKSKHLIILMLSISLCACASVPPPPHCIDDGQGLKPINPAMLTHEQAAAVRAELQPQTKKTVGFQGVDK